MSAPDLLGQLQSAIGDRYLIEREIARGGMATVYLATDQRYGRKVAVKVVESALSGAIGADRFLREIQIAARLSHPHIVPLYDSGEGRDTDAGVLFYVMPFIAGESLRDRLSRNRVLGYSETVRIVREVSSALEYAHRLGVVHRDIKPENILLSEGHAVVTDFGIARAVLEAATSATITRVGMMVGTPAYMSPEQASDSALVDGRSDQYSLACVVYELLTGQPPFTGPSVMALVTQHLTAAPPPLRTPEPVPDSVEQTLRRALAKTPTERFAGLDEFAAAFIAGDAATRATMPHLPSGVAPPRAPRIPLPITPLLGRDDEVRTVLALLQKDSVRLLTLHGPGGIGKTRLALEVAAQASAFFRDGIFFVPLTEVHDSDAMYARIAQATGLRGSGMGSPDALRDHLAERAACLVMDNFEQLVNSAPLIGALLAECPNVKALVTSQVLLHVYGEHGFPVNPLRVPEASQSTRPGAALESAAVRLFVDRAIASKPDFQLTTENTPAVIGICTQLDGVPLAIELAAARVRSHSPQHLLPKLTQALDLLSGGARDLPARQRTMRGAIAWCHALLTDTEKMVFRRLSVFAGGATTEATTAICGADSMGESVDDVLTSLADHSLVRQQIDAGGDTRYTMLRPIHAFAHEMLSEANEGEEVALRHAEFFRDLAIGHEQRVMQHDESAIDRVECEHDNLRAALDLLAARGEIGEALRMSVALWRYWDARGYAREGLERLRHLLDVAAAEIPVRTRLTGLYAAGILADSCGDYALGKRLFEQHLDLTRGLGDPRATSIASNNLAVLLLRQGDIDGAIPLFDAVVEAFRDVDPRAAAMSIANIGNGERLRRNFGAARVRYEEALRLFADAGDETNVGWALSHLGDVARDEGDVAQAHSRYREALATFEPLGNKRGMSAVLTDLGDLATAEGKLLEARAALEEALVNAADVGDQRAMVRVFGSMAAHASAAGDDSRALRLAGSVAGLRDRLGAPLSTAEHDRLERSVAAAITRLGDSESERAWDAGLAMSIEEVVRLVTIPETL